MPPDSPPPVRLRILGPLELRGPSGRDPSAVLGQPKRLALLACLALAPRGTGRRRDHLLALLWPELDGRHARNALSQALHRLRRSLGPDLLMRRGNDEVAIDPAVCWCDTAEFDELLKRGDDAGAMALYRGDLLEGLHVSGAAPELDDWLERERERLRSEAVAAAWRLSDAERAAGSPAGAAGWARRAARLARHDETILRRLLLLLEELGDLTGAVAAYEEFAERLGALYDLEPSNETAVLALRIRRDLTRRAGPPPHSPQPVPGASASGRRTPPRRPPRWRSGVVQRVAWLLPVVLGAGSAAWLAAGAGGAPPVLAVGHIAVQGTDSLDPLPLLLAMNLGRVPALTVLSDTRIRQVLDYSGPGADAAEDLRRAARLAGADQILEGILSTRQPLRLDLRRVDLHSGKIRNAYSVEGNDPFDLVDAVVEAVALDMGTRAPANRFGVTTGSLVSFRLYQEGLHSYYAGDLRAAARLFLSALAEDSTFAMAAYYAALSHQDDVPARYRYLDRARALGDGASERERLLIQTEWDRTMQEPAALAHADSLATLFPHEPVGLLLRAQALLTAGDFLGAVRQFRRVITLDSAGLGAEAASCLACTAHEGLATAYVYADSLVAAEAVLREWVRRRPRSAPAWEGLAGFLEGVGRYGEAEAAARLATHLHPAGAVPAGRWTGIWIRSGDLAAVERLWEKHLRTGDRVAQLEALAGQVTLFRTQGRLREAMVAARRLRRLHARDEDPPAASVQEAVLEAQVWFELGDFRRAGALFDSIAAAADGPTEARRARARAWALTHAATAWAAAGDTARLALLEDSIRVLGSRSSYGRDQRLHYYVRGLRLKRAGRLQEAAWVLERARYAPSEGYVRVNLELADALVTLHRPQAALPVLQAALRGPIGASGTYATRTELHELAGRAFDAAGRPDSAVAHYRWAAEAWRAGDLPFRARRRALLGRIAELEPAGS